MDTPERIAKAIDVSSFERIRLQANNVENVLEIRQGQRESLTIEADPDLFPRIQAAVVQGQLTIQMGGSWLDKLSAALATSLSRPQIRYVVTIRHLTGLDLFGLVHASVHNVQTERLRVKLGGVGRLQIAGLDAKRLDVRVARPSPCRIEVSGRAREQHVSLNGMSEYDAHGLDSRRATVALRGPGGHAVVWADEELDINVSGPGRVEYYGDPKVKQKISPMGMVAHLSAARA